MPGLPARFFAPVITALGRATSVVAKAFRSTSGVHRTRVLGFDEMASERQGAWVAWLRESQSARSCCRDRQSFRLRPVGMAVLVTKGIFNGTQWRRYRRALPG